MANRVQISCIRKNDRQSAYERISSIGGTNPTGRSGRLLSMKRSRALRAGSGIFTQRLEITRLTSLLQKQPPAENTCAQLQTATRLTICCRCRNVDNR